MGAHIIQDKFENIDMNNRAQVGEETKKEVLALLKKTIRPEFLNRVDEFVMFTPLNMEEVKQIVEIQLEHLKKNLLEKNIHLKISNEVIRHIAELGYEPQFGARPIKRVIQRAVLNELSKEILSGKVAANSKISIEFKEGKLLFNN